MFRTLAFFCVTALFLANLPLPAQAAGLTAQQTQSFVQAIPDMEALSDKMRAEGKDAVLESSVRPKPGDTDFKPYTKGMVTLKEKFPADYIVLEETVEKYGFANAGEWATTGDQVMMAYLATKMEGKQYDALKQMAAVPAEVLAKLPPKVTSQIEQAKTVIKVAEQVPPEDKETVRPHTAAIDAWLAREQKKMGLSTQAPASVNTGVMTPAPKAGSASPFATPAVKTTP